MTELLSHIEYLLQQHNCVIIPRFGGFVTRYVSARCVEDEDVWLPPSRSVGFNPQLTLNDGLLIQSYMTANAITYIESLSLIEAAVAQVKEHLQTKGAITLNGIGRLSLGLDGHYDFVPIPSGMTSPAFYGLDAFCCTKLTEGTIAGLVEEEPATKEPHSFQVVRKTGANYTITVNRELTNYVSAAILALVFYFIWAIPGSRVPTSGMSEAGILVPEVAAVMTNGDETKRNGVMVQDAVHPNMAEETIEPTAAYTLVLAAAIPKKNVQPFVEMLAQDGYSEASATMIRNLVHIVYGRFRSEQEAYQRLAELRASSKHFREAWVTKLP